MPSNERKVGRGEKLRITADVWNTLLEMVKDYKRGGVGGFRDKAAGQPLRTNSTVYVRNYTGILLNDAFKVVRLSGTSLPFNNVTQYQFNNNPVFDAFVPLAVNDIIAITQEPNTRLYLESAGSSVPQIAEIPNSVIPVCVSGVTVCRVWMHDVTHNWANPIPGEIDYLESSETCGQARIIDYVPLDGNVVLAIVNLIGANPCGDAPDYDSDGSMLSGWDSGDAIPSTSNDIYYEHRTFVDVEGLDVPDYPIGGEDPDYGRILGASIVVDGPGHYAVSLTFQIIMEVSAIYGSASPSYQGFSCRIYPESGSSFIDVNLMPGPHVADRVEFRLVTVTGMLHISGDSLESRTIHIYVFKGGADWTACRVPGDSESGCESFSFLMTKLASY